jgi:MFS family permease
MAGSLEKAAYVRLLVAALTSMFLIRVAFGVVLNILSLYLTQDNTTLGFVSIVSPVLEAATVIFAGVVIDRYGHKGVLLTGLGLAATALYALALTRNVYAISLISVFHGVASAFILVTTLAVIATYAPPEHRGREMGLFNFANIFGYIVGYAGAFVLEEAFGQEHLEYAFVLAGVMATAGLLFANQMIQLPPQERPIIRDLHHRASLRDLVQALRNRRLVLLVLPWLIVFMLVAALVTFLPRVTNEALNLSGGVTALGILISGALFVVAQLVWGWLADRVSREGVMLVGAFGFAALMGVVVYVFLQKAGADPTQIFDDVLSHRFVLLALLFAAFAFAPAGLAAIADEAKRGIEGSVMSVYSLSITFGFILGPPIVGFISDTVGTPGVVAFLAAAGALMLAMVVARYVGARLAPSPEEVRA